MMPSGGHPPTKCPRDVANTMYVGKGYKSRFACPACGRSMYQSLNFLGRRRVVCDGVKFTRVYTLPEFLPKEVAP